MVRNKTMILFQKHITECFRWYLCVLNSVILSKIQTCNFHHGLLCACRIIVLTGHPHYNSTVGGKHHQRKWNKTLSLLFQPLRLISHLPPRLRLLKFPCDNFWHFCSKFIFCVLYVLLSHFIQGNSGFICPLNLYNVHILTSGMQMNEWGL